MKKILTATLLCLPLLAASARANCLGPVNVNTGANAWCNINIGGCCPGCGKCPSSPWYTYWPYQAYFQVPAPIGGYPFPWWTSPKPPPVPVSPGIPPAAVQGSSYKPETPAPVQPASYYQPAPSYWYGR